MNRCGRSTRTGSWTPVVCEKPEGHVGAHEETWIDRDGMRRPLLTWTHENWQGDAVWPDTPGAIDVTNERRSRV